MDSKQGQQEMAGANKDVNISISGDQETSTVKNMSSDETPRVGLTKDELMKYANEPFWIRLRNILFASFWIVWISILIAAVGYVVQSPGCKAVAATGVAAASGTNSASSP